MVGPREGERLWDRHILNSLALEPLVPHEASVVDVGSGAGLPGIPLAVVRADLRVTLLEPMLRRTTFLTDVVAELGLQDRVRVVRARAEEHSGRYDVLVARAVAPLNRLVGWCRPMLAQGGVLLALKGASAEGEIAAAADELRQARLTAELLEVASRGGGATRVVRVVPASE